MNTETEYTINRNDLKYKKLRNLDKKRISTLDKNNKEEYSKN